METARPFIDEGKHEFVLSLPKHPIWLRADPARLEQILLNLLNNAAKYTTDGGQIRLTAERQGSDVVVTVKDNGVGIAADMLDRIFEMFAQVDRSLEQAHGGLGIGLAVVKRLVEMHGGSIHVHSDGPGCGSEFAVRLPIRVESSPGRPQMIDANISSSCKLRILIVDDNKDGARMLSLLLQRMGNEICVAHDGLEGLESARDFGPDVVLLDIGLPTLDGYEVAKRIRAEPCGQTAVLIAVTGWAREEDRQRTKEAGFNHYLLKPVEPSLLQKLLATVKPKDSRELAGDQKS
jgi:CheY-like chemotaxis protein